MSANIKGALVEVWWIMAIFFREMVIRGTYPGFILVLEPSIASIACEIRITGVGGY